MAEVLAALLVVYKSLVMGFFVVLFIVVVVSIVVCLVLYDLFAAFVVLSWAFMCFCFGSLPNFNVPASVPLFWIP